MDSNSNSSFLPAAAAVAALPSAPGSAPQVSPDGGVPLPPPFPSLTVKSGQQRTIDAQRLELAALSIEPGGTLIIREGSSEPLHLIVHGDTTIHGEIIGLGASTEDRKHIFLRASGEQVYAVYRHNNVGGNGGSGGTAGGGAGGAGALGTPAGGGGGGGGGGRFQQAARPYVTIFTGMPGVGVRAGAAQQCGAAGGDGGSRGENSDGAALFLTVAGALDGTGGSIRLNGRAGAAGANGRIGGVPRSSYGCQSATGGGGGGGPGGHGGFLIAEVAGTIIAYPDVSVGGGPGGPGGASSDPYRGTGGTMGASGRSGAAHWFKRDE